MRAHLLLEPGLTAVLHGGHHQGGDRPSASQGTLWKIPIFEPPLQILEFDQQDVDSRGWHAVSTSSLGGEVIQQILDLPAGSRELDAIPFLRAIQACINLAQATGHIERWQPRGSRSLSSQSTGGCQFQLTQVHFTVIPAFVEQLPRELPPNRKGSFI